MGRKRRRTGGGVSALEVWLALRKVQRLTACTTTTLYTFLDVMDPFLVTGCTAAEIKHAEKELRGRSGATMIKLNGCVGPNCMHVFEPKDEDTHCPDCGHPRYDDDGQPNEVGFYFPL